MSFEASDGESALRASLWFSSPPPPDVVFRLMPQELEGFARLALKYNLFVISDEVCVCVRAAPHPVSYISVVNRTVLSA